MIPAIKCVSDFSSSPRPPEKIQEPPHNPNYDFLVPLCLDLVQKYEKNAVANEKWFFVTVQLWN
jgi:hypothetical protein